MLKLKDEDAEAVMAKTLEGGSDSEKEETLFPEPAPLEIPGEAMKPDGNETRKSSGEETASKRQKVLFADEKTLPSTSLPAGQPNPVTPILSSLRLSQRLQNQGKHLSCVKKKVVLRN